MATEEIQPKPKPGNIIPGVELRKSLAGVDRCRTFFDDLKLIDYLHSVNEFYLDGKGEIVGPVSTFGAGIPDNSENNTQGIGLKNSWGGLEVFMKWSTENNELERRIHLLMYYETEYDYYQLYLTGQTTHQNTLRNLPSVGKSFHRVFRINPPSITQDEIDGILLNFTNELQQAGVI